MNAATHIADKEKTSSERGGHLVLKRKPLVIEFVGPTGSGKTTNCLHFSNRFKKANLNVYGFSDVKAYLHEMTFYRRLFIYSYAFLSNVSNVFNYALVLAANGIYSVDSIYRYLKLSIFNIALRQFIATRDVDLLFLDQWIIQGLWSATIFKARSYDRLQQELKNFYFPTAYVLYFDIDEKTAAERIGARHTGRSRFDVMDEPRRLATLTKYNQYLYQLYKNSDCKNKIIFSTRVSPLQNAEDFFSHLQSLNTPEN